VAEAVDDRRGQPDGGDSGSEGTEGAGMKVNAFEIIPGGIKPTDRWHPL
jgi:hypothetical protein